jgi:hypothetical protein
MCVFLAVTILALIEGLSPAYSQAACHFSDFRVAHPDYTPAGQPFETVTTVRVICSGAADAFEEIRVDLTDPHTTDQTVLSRKTYTTPTVGAITTQITNDITAPFDTGTWVLQANAYVIGRPSGMALASNQLLFNVIVTPYTPPSTTISSITMTPITITTKPLPSSTSQVTISTQALTTRTETMIQDYSTYYRIAGLLGLVAVVGLIAVMRRKKRKAKEKTQVY